MKAGALAALVGAVAVLVPAASATTGGERGAATRSPTLTIPAASPGHVSLKVFKVRFRGADAARAPARPRLQLGSSGPAKGGVVLGAVHVARSKGSTVYTFVFAQLTPRRSLAAASRRSEARDDVPIGSNGDFLRWLTFVTTGIDPGHIQTNDDVDEMNRLAFRTARIKDVDRTAQRAQVKNGIEKLLEDPRLGEGWDPIAVPQDASRTIDTSFYDDGHAFGWKRKTAAAKSITWFDDVLLLLTTPPEKPVVSIVDDLFAQAGLGPTAPPGGGGFACDPNGLSDTLFRSFPTAFDPRNPYSESGAAPTFSTGGKAYCLDSITTEHYNAGKGVPAVTLGLRRSDGTLLGPWPARALPGGSYQWRAAVPAGTTVLLDGTYSVVDSDPSTWTSNADSGGIGFTQVAATPAKKAG